MLGINKESLEDSLERILIDNKILVIMIMADNLRIIIIMEDNLDLLQVRLILF